MSENAASAAATHPPTTSDANLPSGLPSTSGTEVAQGHNNLALEAAPTAPTSVTALDGTDPQIDEDALIAKGEASMAAFLANKSKQKVR